MAVDEAILKCVGCGDAPPTLRLYAWQPPCISLGYAQPVADVSLAALESRGWDIVRRPTGGQAILHMDELTYSVIGPKGEPRLEGGVLQSYLVIAQALLGAVESLGIQAQASMRPKSNHEPSQAHANGEGSREKARKNPVCFETPSDYEITVAGRKLIGSAQARRKEGVLQHGSLPLFGDITRIIQVLEFESPAAREEAERRLLARAVTVENVLGVQLTWTHAAQAFKEAFEGKLNLELQEFELTPSEMTYAAELVREKYNHPDWTNRI